MPSTSWGTQLSVGLTWLGAFIFAWLFFLPAFAPDLQHGLLDATPAAFRMMITPEWNIAPATRLRWLLALLPAGLIVHHVLFLKFQRVKAFPTSRPRPATDRDPLLPTSADVRETYFGTWSLALSYFFPAIMVAALCSIGVAALTEPNLYWSAAFRTSFPAWSRVLLGMQAGFAGAYLSVVLTLATRTIRRDLTSGIAVWAAALLVLGPTLAGAIAYFWTGADSGSFAPAVAFFAAGMAPTRFSVVIDEVGRRLLQANQAPIERNIIPLNRIRGITADVEERLLEEGIGDASALAYADPFALMRATTYSKRHIAAWMDEALLMLSVPPATYEGLKTQGVTGVIDLAWYHIEPSRLPALATAAKLDLPVLTDIAARLYEDAQVRIVWTLYQTDSEAEPAMPEAGMQLVRPDRRVG